MAERSDLAWLGRTHFSPRGQARCVLYVQYVCTHSAQRDRQIECLWPMVLLVGLDVIPHLWAAETRSQVHRAPPTPSILHSSLCPTPQLTYLSLARQVDLHTMGARICHRVNQQRVPWNSASMLKQGQINLPAPAPAHTASITAPSPRAFTDHSAHQC